MRRLIHRRKLAAAAAVAVLAIVGAAVAYWTTTGSGTGSATTGTNAAVTVTQVGTVTGLVPGGSAQAVDFKITNPKTTPQYVTHVNYSISSIMNGASPAVGCSAADFTLVQPSWTAADLAAGDTTFSPSGATLAMVDS